MVENDPVVRETLSKIVGNRGHEVREFSEAEAALGACRASRPDILILDWDQSGLVAQFLAEVRKTPGCATAVVLGTTTSTDPCDLNMIVNEGADGYLTKPIDEMTVNAKLDIADRLVERRLTDVAAEGRYHSVIAAMAEGVVVLDATGQVTDVNDAAETLLRRSEDGLIGGRLFDGGVTPIHPDGTPCDEAALPFQKTLNDGIPVRNVVVGLRYEGSRITWLSVNVQPVGHHGHELEGGVVVSLNDVTETIREKDQREQVAIQVQNAQKLESLGVLAGGIAHDFNNLLVGILGNASLALMEIEEESPARELLEQIETTSMRAAELTNQMLAYSGRGKFIIQRLSLQKLVEEMAPLLSTALSKKATIEYEFTEDLPVVMGDVSQMRQVVMNLITNASDALGNKLGNVRVRTGLTEVADGEVLDATANETLPAGEYVFLEVVDSGEGMSEEVLERVFDPFFTTKFTGRGLGLAAVLGIVRGHQGAIKVWSRPGRGSSFKVFLPGVSDTAVRPKTGGLSDVDDMVDAAEQVVLIVDDEETVRQVVQSMLERMGYNVIVAEDGAAGVKAFENHRHRVGAVLLDLTMPVMSGGEAYRRIMEIDPAARVLVMSGFNETAAVEHFGGVKVDFIQKPFKPATLKDKVIAMIGEPIPST